MVLRKARAAGRVKDNVEPSPNVGSTHTLSPWRSAIRFTTATPIFRSDRTRFLASTPAAAGSIPLSPRPSPLRSPTADEPRPSPRAGRRRRHSESLLDPRVAPDHPDRPSGRSVPAVLDRRAVRRAGTRTSCECRPADPRVLAEVSGLAAASGLALDEPGDPDGESRTGGARPVRCPDGGIHEHLRTVQVNYERDPVAALPVFARSLLRGEHVDSMRGWQESIHASRRSCDIPIPPRRRAYVHAVPPESPSMIVAISLKTESSPASVPSELSLPRTQRQPVRTSNNGCTLPRATGNPAPWNN